MTEPGCSIDVMHTSNSQIIAVFQYEIITFQAQFHVISAFSTENSKIVSWHLYCNSQ